MKIDSIGASVPTTLTQGPRPAAGGQSAGFGDALKNALDGVNNSQKRADQLTREFQMENSKVGLEETMVAATKANIEFQALLQVRNKVVSAYQEIMNMQV